MIYRSRHRVCHRTKDNIIYMRFTVDHKQRSISSEWKKSLMDDPFGECAIYIFFLTRAMVEVHQYFSLILPLNLGSLRPHPKTDLEKNKAATHTG